MIYEFMRLVLFFDLPMKTKKEVKKEKRKYEQSEGILCKSYKEWIYDDAVFCLL